jgi:hypothetical protein
MKSKAAAAAKAKRDASAAKARAATSKVGSKPVAKKTAVKKALPAYARLGKNASPKKYTMIKTKSGRFGGSGKTKVEVGSVIIRNRDGSIKKIKPPTKKK